MDNSHFDLDALYSYIAYPCGEAERAEIILGHRSGTAVFPTKESEFSRLLLIASTVEHEFTHHRQLLSTPLGFALYLANLACTEYRRNWLSAVPYPEFSYFVRDAHGRADPLKFIKQHRLERHPCAKHLFVILHWQCFVDLLFRFDISKALFWQEQRDPIAARLVINPYGKGSEDVFGWFSLLFVNDDSYIVSSLPTATLMELIEGAAVWREYAYVSGTLWQGFRPLFGRLTRWWLHQSIRNLRYRKAADLIYKATGCNLSSALPGVLFDIALTPPMFAPRRVPWSEAHPSLRFAQILQVIANLPRQFRRYDNLDLVGDDFYQEVEQWVSKRLGWSSVIENLRCGFDAIMTRYRFVERLPAPQFIVHRAAFLNPIIARFRLAHQWRLDAASMFLFPWVRSDYRWLRLLTCPPITEYSDSVRLNPQYYLNETIRMAVLYGYRAVVTLFLGHTVNLHGASAIARARRLYDKLLAAIPNYIQPNEYSTVGFTPQQSFESFISESLEIDYQSHRDIVTGMLG